MVFKLIQAVILMRIHIDILITFLHIYITIPLKANAVVKNVTAFANRLDPLSRCESVVYALKMLDLNSIWGASKNFVRKHAPHLPLTFCILRACSERHAFGSPETSLFFMSKLRTESLSQGRGSHKSCIQESERLRLLITLAQMFFHSGWPLCMSLNDALEDHRWTCRSTEIMKTINKFPKYIYKLDYSI